MLILWTSCNINNQQQSLEYKSIKNQTIMKNLKTLALLFAMTFSTAIFASSAPSIEEPSNLNKEITSLLKSPNFEISEEMQAMVTITFNKHNEIVVLSVDSENDEVVNFIKHRLNYHKVTSTLDADKVIVPVRLLKS